MKRRPPLDPGAQPLADDPLWYKDAVIYELRVRSYMDENGDGIGDFPGLTSKLDYLQDLGVTALWLLPICPSPGRDDGYDIADYVGVHPDMGTIDDVKRFLDEAHRRGIRVITELVLNHTSDKHPWFQRARRAPAGSPERDFYVWSESPAKYEEARIIFKDFEPSNWSWDPVAKAYFWHRFYSHQPDLNFDNPAVHEALLSVTDFWFELGVDGLRLDAVPYLYEREGTSCENLAETHAFLKKLRAHVDSRFHNRLLLAEANQWPEDAAAYFGNGDECHMNFHFPIMPRIFMSIHMEDRLPIIDILAQTPQLPGSCQWALFLRNHDELTLEMVTDEERDYMYRAFAHDTSMRINLGIRRRLAPLVGNNRRNIELMNGLLFSLPGTPVMYYGDEIAMGDNVFLGDRNGVRTPMQWSADRNAGFSRANPQRLILPIIIDPEYHYESLNVEAQQANPNSLLWWTKKLIALRKRFQAFGRGTIEFLSPENPKVLSFIRQYESETILVVANLSRHVQYVELNLSKLKGKVPIELFGRTRFPAIGELPYLLTLGEHAFYWFVMEDPVEAAAQARELAYVPPSLSLSRAFDSLFSGREREALESILPAFIEGRRWFRGRARDLTETRIVDLLPLPAGEDSIQVAIVRVEYAVGEPDHYVLPLMLVVGERAEKLRARAPQSIIATFSSGEGQALLADALGDASGVTALLSALRQRPASTGTRGQLLFSVDEALPGEEGAEVRFLKGDHEHAVAVEGDRYVLKFFRQLGEGMSPEREVSRFLRAHKSSAPVPALLGSIDYAAGRAEPITLATVARFVPNEDTAWSFTHEELRRYFDRVLASRHEQPRPPLPEGTLLARAELQPDDVTRELLGNYLPAARLIGIRTAELHLALSRTTDDDAFSAEPYSTLDQRSIYQGKRNVIGKVLRLLRTRLPSLAPHLAEAARRLVDHETALYKRFEPLLGRRYTAMKIRVHGDYHLGNMLYTGKDFVVVDFDGDSWRPLAERRRRRTSLRDVASMLRSFDYAAFSTLYDEAVVRAADREAAEPWARLWLSWVEATFLAGYAEAAGGAPFMSRDPEEQAVKLDTLVIERALEEIHAEIDRRPEWAGFAMRAVAEMLGIVTPPR